MPPRQRILTIRLTEKISKNPEYAKKVGIETKIKITNGGKRNDKNA